MGETKPPKSVDKPRARQRKRSHILTIGIVALAAAVALATVLLTQDEGADSEPNSTPIGAPRIVSEEELQAIAADADYTVFWAGPAEDQQLEVGENGGGILVRYLSEGAAVGGEAGAALAVGSYPMKDPTGAVTVFSEREDAIVRKADDGRTVVSSLAAPSSVYFASPDGGVQVEVYDPSPERALKLAASGAVTPVP